MVSRLYERSYGEYQPLTLLSPLLKFYGRVPRAVITVNAYEPEDDGRVHKDDVCQGHFLAKPQYFNERTAAFGCTVARTELISYGSNAEW